MNIEQLDLYNQLSRSVSQSQTCFTVFGFISSNLLVLPLLVMIIFVFVAAFVVVFCLFASSFCLILCRNFFLLVYDLNANCHCCQILIEGDLRCSLPTTSGVCVSVLFTYESIFNANAIKRFCSVAVVVCGF